MDTATRNNWEKILMIHGEAYDIGDDYILLRDTNGKGYNIFRGSLTKSIVSGVDAEITEMASGYKIIKINSYSVLNAFNALHASIANTLASNWIGRLIIMDKESKPVFKDKYFSAYSYDTENTGVYCVTKGTEPGGIVNGVNVKKGLVNARGKLLLAVEYKEIEFSVDYTQLTCRKYKNRAKKKNVWASAESSGYTEYTYAIVGDITNRKLAFIGSKEYD